MAEKQKWECPRCGYTYVAAINVFEVLCPHDHVPANGRGRIGRQPMVLTAGPQIEPRKGQKKESTRGKKASRGT